MCDGGGQCVGPPECRNIDRITDVAQNGGAFVFEGAGQGSGYLGACGGVGPEAIYKVTIDEFTQMRVTATGATPEDRASLYVRSECDNSFSEIDCQSGAQAVSLQFQRIEPGTYYVFVDSQRQGAGTFDIYSTCGSGAGCGRDQDCPATNICVENFCVEAQCIRDEQCDVDEGQRCESGRCVQRPNSLPSG